jgi:cation transport ATPase
VGRFIVLHIPHIIPVLVAFAFLGRLALVVADQPPVSLDESAVDAWRNARSERAQARRVRRSTSRIGLIALVPLLGAAATGLVLYTFALDGHHPSSTLSWVHSVISVIALVLVGWKLADSGLARLRRGLDPHRLMTEGASLLLAALGLPLIVTGAWLLLYPSEGSFASNAHLVASVWWVALFGAHLFRYLGRSVDAALRHRSSDEL